MNLDLSHIKDPPALAGLGINQIKLHEIMQNSLSNSPVAKADSAAEYAGDEFQQHFGTNGPSTLPRATDRGVGSAQITGFATQVMSTPEHETVGVSTRVNNEEVHKGEGGFSNLGSQKMTGELPDSTSTKYKAEYMETRRDHISQVEMVVPTDVSNAMLEDGNPS